MANTITIIKRSPVVLVRTFIAIELLSFLAYFLITGHGSYKSELYNQLFLVRLFPYETAKLFFLSGMQFCITVYAFAYWYFKAYSFRPGSLTEQRGVFFKKRKTTELSKGMTVMSTSGFLGKLLHYGTITISNGDRQPIMLYDVSRPGDVIRTIERCINPQSAGFKIPEISELLQSDEHEKLEFKSSLRFDYKLGQPNRELEKAVMKTVAAFLNSKGGYLVLGVNDMRAPLGLTSDYQTLQRKDSDGFANHFTQSFNSMIGPEFRNLIKVSFHAVENREVCLIQALPSPRPVYLKVDNNEYFYMRTGNITTALKLSEIESYRHSRWPQRSIKSV